MLGRSHMIIGAAGFLAGGAPLLTAIGHPLTPGELACGTVVAAGAALLPDIDHPQATVARAWGPVSFVASRVIHRLAGGHRQGTHSLLGLALVSVGVALLMGLSGGLLIPLLLTFACVSLVTRQLLDMTNPIASVLVALAASVGLLAVTPGFAWLPLAIAIGYALHLAADAVTEEGVPLLWPRPGRLSLGLMRTGSWRERITAFAFALLLAFAGWHFVLAPLLSMTHPGVGV